MRSADSYRREGAEKQAEVDAQIIADAVRERSDRITELEAENARMREALEPLLDEVKAIIAFGPSLRQVTGYTNWRELVTRARAADEALKPASEGGDTTNREGGSDGPDD